MKNFILFCAVAMVVAVACKPGKNKNEASLPLSLGMHIADTSYFRPLTAEEKTQYHNEVEAAFQKILGKGFNGQILVAKNGQIVFEDYQGTYNFQTGEPISENTPMHLASISKTFTGMTILHLWEEGRISMDDSIQKFFPAFPYHGITVKMLLSHRSGLPNYLNFLDHGWDRHHKASNQDVINFMIANKPPIQASPGKRFHYCNTNFMLLASIIEKVVHRPFPQYMKDSVFLPLGMQHTFVFEAKDTLNYVMTYNGRRPYPMDHLDLTYGDKNVYSTARDLLLWDRSLYMHNFLKASTLKMAYEPQSNERASMHNYGLAWRMLFDKKGDSIIYHNGKWHGSNTVFTRLLQDTATIIILGNRLDRRIYAAKALAAVFIGTRGVNRYIIPDVEMQGETGEGSPEESHGRGGYKSR